MRFELFLERLPRANLEEVKTSLAELPAGVSVGLILKGLENGRVPTVPVAYSDDKRIMNEIGDTLLELGAEHRLVDHGNPIAKLSTFLAERMGAARYLEDEAAPVTHYKLKHGGARSLPALLLEHALSYALQLVAVEILLVWFVGLRVGLLSVGSLPELPVLMCAGAVGVLCAYTATTCVDALRAGRLKLLRAAPVFAATLACTLASLFFLGASGQSTAAARNQVKVESKPYAGLLAELRRRELAAELGGVPLEEEPTEAPVAAATVEGPLLCEAAPEARVEECVMGPAWDEWAACLPLPSERMLPAVAAPSLSEPIAGLGFGREQASTQPATAPPPARDASAWQITLDASALLTLGGLWLLIALGLLGYEFTRRAHRRREQRAAEPASEPVSNVEPALQATGELVGPRGQPTMTRTAEPAPIAEVALVDNEALSRLQYELTLARDELIASQAQQLELRRQLANSNRQRDELQQELSQLKQQLAEAALESKKSPTSELEALPHARKPANDDTATRKLLVPTRREEDDDDADNAARSGREDRVVLPKRRA